ncbi:MAG: LCCL domain-containing protein [Leptolyngbyaceae cyanobacterium]
MPHSLVIAVFVFGAVLILLALSGGKFKIFGSEISESVSNPLLRIIAGVVGTFLLVLALDLQAPFGINIFGGEQPAPQSQQPNPDSPGINLPFVEQTEEISWRDSARDLAGSVGQDFKFKCPEGGTISRVYGTDIYTSSSSVCSAAVHAGLIDTKSGGNIKIRSLGAQSFFNGTTRNGVQSQGYGQYDGSFTFLDGRSPIATEQIQLISWNDSASGVRARLEQEFEYMCPEGGNISRVYGTDIYTSTSSICSAAVHAGVINARDGGRVKIQILGPQKFFNGTERNGISSLKYGEYNSAFLFIE